MLKSILLIHFKNNLLHKMIWKLWHSSTQNRHYPAKILCITLQANLGLSSIKLSHCVEWKTSVLWLHMKSLTAFIRNLSWWTSVRTRRSHTFSTDMLVVSRIEHRLIRDTKLYLSATRYNLQASSGKRSSSRTSECM